MEDVVDIILKWVDVVRWVCINPMGCNVMQCNGRWEMGDGME